MSSFPDPSWQHQTPLQPSPLTEAQEQTPDKEQLTLSAQQASVASCDVIEDWKAEQEKDVAARYKHDWYMVWFKYFFGATAMMTIWLTYSDISKGEVLTSSPNASLSTSITMYKLSLTALIGSNVRSAMWRHLGQGGTVTAEFLHESGRLEGDPISALKLLRQTGLRFAGLVSLAVAVATHAIEPILQASIQSTGKQLYTVNRPYFYAGFAFLALVLLFEVVLSLPQPSEYVTSYGSPLASAAEGLGPGLSDKRVAILTRLPKSMANVQVGLTFEDPSESNGMVGHRYIDIRTETNGPQSANTE
ncbi:uncharacterized protein PSANT_04644 [Moesziomyces antarcticus]|uniref:Uncharacterized protein n=1 Tax=Pseudozyma antarctica TaxID=84753 RepID=A0A5C3FR99_PSEA2|nr:uncharacterized protein PSANT_04644 [Moesziomyces antarcticus]